MLRWQPEILTLKNTAGMEGDSVISWAIPFPSQMKSLGHIKETIPKDGVINNPFDHMSVGHSHALLAIATYTILIFILIHL